MLKIISVLSCLCLLSWCAGGGTAWAQSALKDKLKEYITKAELELGNDAVLSFKVANIANEKEIFAHNSTQLMIPASVLKIVTSIAALKVLGADYRFPTEVFVDHRPSEKDIRLQPPVAIEPENKSEWKAGNLYFRGYGDPSLVSEDLLEIAQMVFSSGVQEIDNLVIDDGLFLEPPMPSGPQPYQAALSSVAVNFNCYRISVAPAASGALAYVMLTPGAPYAIKNLVRTRQTKGTGIEISQSPPNPLSAVEIPQPKMVQHLIPLAASETVITVVGRTGINSEYSLFYRAVPEPVVYTANILRYYLEQAGVKVKGKLLRGETAAGAKQVVMHKSKTLAEILRDLNHYSSNFTACHILYAMGQDRYGYFRKELGLQKMRAILGELGIESSSFRFTDGSGLSADNRVSVEQLVKLLASAYQDFSVAPDFISSLSRFGQSGTLKKRELLDVITKSSTAKVDQARKRRADSVWGKTGTIDNVSSVAGYLETELGDRVAYAILINGNFAKDKAIEVENNLLKIVAGLDLEKTTVKESEVKEDD